MNKTPYDNWLVNLLDLIQRVIINFKSYKQAFINKFNYKPTDKELKQKVQDGIIDYSKRIQGASTTPKSKGFRPNYKYIKFTLTDEYEQLLMDEAKDLDSFVIDYSYLNLDDKTFYIKGKSAAQRFLLSDTTSTHVSTNIINKYIDSGQPYENKFYVEEISSVEYKAASGNKKIKLLKDL